ncbi:MAG: P-loop NTPase [Bdellovibrionota bacterium]
MDLVQITGEKCGMGNSIWAVASGKGGVGKSFISASLAITVAKLGHPVVIVDLDITGANSHTCLGMNPSPLNLRHYFDGSKTLQEIIVPSSIPKLSLIQGLWDSWNLFELTADRVEKLVKDLRELTASYVIIDLGAGGTHGNIEVFKHVDEKILVTTPEPTSLEKNYRFIEGYICSKIQPTTTPDKYMDWIHALREKRHSTNSSAYSIRNYITDKMPESLPTFEAMNNSPIHVVVNSVRSHEQSSLGYSIRSVCNKYFELEVNFLGSINYDNAVWQSIRLHEPVLIAQPFTPLAGQFLSLCKHLIDPEELRAVV